MAFPNLTPIPLPILLRTIVPTHSLILHTVQQIKHNSPSGPVFEAAEDPRQPLTSQN